MTLALVILLRWSLAQGLRIVTGIDTRLFIDVDHAASRAVLGVILPPAGTELSRFHHQDLFKLILQLCSSSIAYVRSDDGARVLSVRDSAVVLAMEDASNFSRISTVVHSWIGT